MINLNDTFAKQIAHFIATVKSSSPEGAPGFVEFIEHSVDNAPEGNEFAVKLREIIKAE